MSTLKIGREHKARKALFTRGIRRGFLTLVEIDQALPPGSLSDAERWLLFYSLHAARVTIRDGDGRPVALDELRPAEDHDGDPREPADSEETEAAGTDADEGDSEGDSAMDHQ